MNIRLKSAITQEVPFLRRKANYRNSNEHITISADMSCFTIMAKSLL